MTLDKVNLHTIWNPESNNLLTGQARAVTSFSGVAMDRKFLVLVPIVAVLGVARSCVNQFHGKSRKMKQAENPLAIRIQSKGNENSSLGFEMDSLYQVSDLSSKGIRRYDAQFTGIARAVIASIATKITKSFVASLLAFGISDLLVFASFWLLISNKKR